MKGQKTEEEQICEGEKKQSVNKTFMNTKSIDF